MNRVSYNLAGDKKTSLMAKFLVPLQGFEPWF